MSTFTVVIGAGSAGATIASRLTEDPGHRVLLIEAGPDYPSKEDAPPSIRNPYDLAEDHYWDLAAYYVEPGDSREPVAYPRGKVVGGSSNVNASFAVRGAPEDFERWVAMGNDEWSWDAVLPFYKRIETDAQFGNESGHGNDGPINVTRVPRDVWPTAVLAFEQACLQRGFPALEDGNEPKTIGIGPAPRNQTDDVQSNALFTYIARARSRPNLNIRSGVKCRRVIVEEGRVVAVEIEGHDGVERIDADRVVLSAGAVHTPQLLMLSGIGPADVLGGLGIDVVADVPGVGKNLQDHPINFVVCVLKPDVPGKRFGGLAMLKASSSPEDFNDIWLFPPVLEPSALMLDLDLGESKAMSLAALVAKPRSSGWLTITSADPDVAPEIHMNYLGDDSDLERMKGVVRLAHDIATSSPVQEVVQEVLFPDASTVADDDLLETWLKETVSTGYHAAGTCRMGPETDPDAVVDQRLAVRGVEGLWVADASVMPSITTAFTNLTAFMIGERAADILSGANVSGGAR